MKTVPLPVHASTPVPQSTLASMAKKVSKWAVHLTFIIARLLTSFNLFFVVIYIFHVLTFDSVNWESGGGEAQDVVGSFM